VVVNGAGLSVTGAVSSTKAVTAPSFSGSCISSSTSNVETNVAASSAAVKVANDASIAAKTLATEANTLATTANNTANLALPKAGGIVTGDITLGTVGTQVLGAESDAVATPSFSWTNDSNTGVYRSGAGAVGITTAGVNKVNITSSVMTINTDTIVKGTLTTLNIKPIDFRGLGHPDKTAISINPYRPSTHLQFGEMRLNLDFMLVQNNSDLATRPPLKTYLRFNITGNSDNGAIQAFVNFENLSDDRIKTDEALITNATQTLNKLRPQVYNKWSSLDFNSNGHSSSFKESGIIAQEIFYDAPELRHLVSVPADANSNIYFNNITSSKDPSIDPDYKDWGSTVASVNYIGLIPYLVKSAQEKDTQINEMSGQYNDLLDRILALENK
jgi:hypothetical protein